MLLRLLGAPALNHADGTLVFAPERRFQLLALLAHRGEWMSRERLAALFWPDHSAEAARRNLRKVLHRLHELGTEIFAATPVQEQGGAMRWPVATDLAEFEQAVDRGDRTRALAVWQGEPWQGIDGSGGVPLLEWLGIERQRLTSRWRDTLLAEARASTEPLTVLRHAELAMAQNPLDEEALRVPIEAWLRIDRRVDATRAYMAFSRRLAESLALEPSARTRELLQESRRSAAGAVSEAPDTAAAALPFVVDSGFIGRDAEQRELSALLAQPDCRWVTVVGPGGIGKSRLLMRAIDRFGDTARWIPLEGASSSAGLANRIGSALGLPVAGEEAEAYAQLAAGIGKTERLLALDNLEHLLPAVPRLAMLLQGCPGLRIVATSRERVGVEGEWLVPLAGLPFPELEDSDRAEAFDAVRLFVVRARQVDPRFELGPQRDGVVELCRWVEGMPLAIELAAVWIRHFRADEIAREVRSGGEMLREPAGTQFAPRQRSKRRPSNIRGNCWSRPSARCSLRCRSFAAVSPGPRRRQSRVRRSRC